MKRAFDLKRKHELEEFGSVPLWELDREKVSRVAASLLELSLERGCELALDELETAVAGFTKLELQLLNELFVEIWQAVKPDKPH